MMGDQSKPRSGVEGASGAVSFPTEPHAQSSTMQRVRFTEDIPIEPALLRQSGYEPDLSIGHTEKSVTDSSGGESNEESDTSARSAPNNSQGSYLPTELPVYTDIQAVREEPRVRGRGRPRGRPRGRGRGASLSTRAGRNPLHVREQTASRGSRPRGSQKGVKKGPRKAAEPSDEFKALKSRATLEYINGNFDEAQTLVEEAISINPEIFSAYALLSSIHQAIGDDGKAVAALFQGAHTTPRNTDTWNSVARSILDLAADRSAALSDAIYCYNRVISTDRDNIEARTNRAQLYVELGRYPKAIHDFKHLLRLSPHHLDTLRSLSECYSLIGTPVEAIACYDGAIEHYRAQNNEQGPPVFWSDVNIYAELYWMSQQYQQGLFMVKQIARWMLGRGLQSYWDDHVEDDREFDADDSRRREMMEYDPSQHDVTAYGFGLPMELRIKLGLFRLKLGQHYYDEAMWHLRWLDPGVNGNEDSIYDYADLFREVASTLKSDGYYEQAVHYLEQLKITSDLPEIRLNIDLGQCYRHLERYSEAEECFRNAASLDEHELEAHEELKELFDEIGDQTQAMYIRSELSLRRRNKAMLARQQLTPGSVNDDPDFPVMSIEDLGVEEAAFDARMLAQPLRRAPDPARSGESSAPGKKRFKEYDLTLRDMIPTFRRLEDLELGFRSGDTASQLEWMALAKEAIEHFQAYKPFWPSDRVRPFTGYSKYTRDRATVPNPGQEEHVTGRSGIYKTSDVVPDYYCGVRFSDWLACIMRYVIRLPVGPETTGSREEAYSVAKTTSTCSIWFSDKDAQFLIHLVWSICALQRKDHETLCEVSRFFMKQYQFITDSYRMYAALNRYCNNGNEWYNMSPSQKYMLRQIKAMDLSLLDGGGEISSVYDERAQLSKDEQGNVIAPKETDVALLVVYGHMLFATTSYAFGLHYFYRAHNVEPNNPMILLSLAVGYTHYAVKRQAENRQALISCGLSFLLRYYDTRKVSSSPLHRQEAEYNVGRTFHFLGLLDLAIPYYERCLALSTEVEKLQGEERVQNFAREAAYALRGFHAQAGDFAAARQLTETWLCL